MCLKWGTVGDIQSTRDQSGRESHHEAKEGFQVSKKGFRDGAGMSKQGGCQRDWVMHFELC